MKKIETENAPKAIGPYSQAILCDNLLFISGQIPVDPKTGLVVEGIDNQANQAFKNIGEILKASNMDFNNVVKTTVFLNDIKNFGIVNEIYSNYFISKPARSLVEVSNLPKGVMIEIEAIAKK